jgi:hypothetical protein
MTKKSTSPATSKCPHPHVLHVFNSLQVCMNNVRVVRIVNRFKSNTRVFQLSDDEMMYVYSLWMNSTDPGNTLSEVKNPYPNFNCGFVWNNHVINNAIRRRSHELDGKKIVADVRLKTLVVKELPTHHYVVLEATGFLAQNIVCKIGEASFSISIPTLPVTAASNRESSTNVKYNESITNLDLRELLSSTKNILVSQNVDASFNIAGYVEPDSNNGNVEQHKSCIDCAIYNNIDILLKREKIYENSSVNISNDELEKVVGTNRVFQGKFKYYLCFENKKNMY